MRGKGIWRGLAFLPQVMPFVAVGLVFQIVFASPQGLVNNLLGTNIEWLTNFAIAKYVVVGLLVWQGFGFWFVVFLAGLTTMDPALEDAAIVDGASAVQKTLRVTVPLMKNVIFFAVIIDAIGSMALYTQPNVLTTNGNGLAVPQVGTVSNIVVSNLQAGVFGQSAAAGVLIFMLTLIVSAVLFATVCPVRRPSGGQGYRKCHRLTHLKSEKRKVTTWVVRSRLHSWAPGAPSSRLRCYATWCSATH